MKILIKFFQIIIFVLTILLVYANVFVGIFSDNTKLTTVVESSGLYEKLGDSIKQQIGLSIAENNQYASAIKDIVNENLNENLTKSILQPTQASLIAWLNQNQTDPDIALDLSRLKTRLTDASKDKNLSFEINKLVPDSFSVKDLDSSYASLTSQLEIIKSLYSYTKTSIPYLYILLIASLIGILALNIRNGSKKFSRAILPALFAGLTGLILALVINITNYRFEYVISESFESFGIVLNIILAVIESTTTIFTIISIALVALLVGLKLIYFVINKKKNIL